MSPSCISDAQSMLYVLIFLSVISPFLFVVNIHKYPTAFDDNAVRYSRNLSYGLKIFNFEILETRESFSNVFCKEITDNDGCLRLHF